MTFDNVDLFPITTTVNPLNHLVIGGVDVVDLVAEHGTPLYLYDESTLRGTCREFVREFTARYEHTQVLYASKAFVNQAIANLINEEGLGFDVVSGGEIAVASASNIAPSKVYFHGNNKTPSELRAALDYGVGRVVLDNFFELDQLNQIAGDMGLCQEVMVRVSPGVDPHTHAKTTTGVLDSKFGFAIETGDATDAIRTAMASSNLSLVGVHFHLGSPIFELEPYVVGIDTVLSFLAGFLHEGLTLKEFSPGGGFAIGYVRDQLPPSVASYAETITSIFKQKCADLGFGEPKLIVEPGRVIVGRAGVAIYTVGAIKTIPDVRKYVSLDGGMGDNIRPALYDSTYEAVVANRMSDKPAEIVTLAGKYCESGDVLIKDIELPKLDSGDLIAIPASGAYAPSMASVYNLNPRPPILMVGEGDSRLIRRREDYKDLMNQDII